MSTEGNLLQLNVEDLLAYVQIKSGRYIKEVQHFNVKKAVEEIPNSFGQVTLGIASGAATLRRRPLTRRCRH